METILLYIVKSSCCLVLFYLGYKALLSHETFFRFNRLVLLAGIIICLLLPLIRLEIKSPGLLNIPVMELEHILTDQGIAYPVASEIAFPGSRDEKAPVSLAGLLLSILLLGTMIHLFFAVRSHIQVLRLIRDNRIIRKGKYRIILLKGMINPFSYGRTIILSEDDYQKNAGIILTHEMAHGRMRHSADLLFMEMVTLLHWFNPVIWLLRRELREVHEFQADMEVLRNGIDATTYQLLLVKKAVGSSSYTFANSFNHSKLKKRITMMLKKESNNWARLKLALLLPMAVVTVYAFARPETNRQLNHFIQSEDTVNLSQSKGITPEFFETELNEYIHKLHGNPSASLKEKHDFLRDRTNILSLLVNSKGDLLFGNKRTPMEQLSEQLIKLLRSDYPNKKPVLINLIIDQGTPDEIKRGIWAIIKEVYSSEKERMTNNHQIVMLLNNDQKNYR